MNKKQPKEKRMVNVNIGNGSPMAAQKISRNAPCKCGSGKKTKKCCGNKTKYFNTKPNKTDKQKQFTK